MRKTVEDEVIENLFIKLLDMNQFDIIHFHHTLGFPFSLIDVSKKCGYPVAVTLHDFWMLCHELHLLGKDGKVHGDPPREISVDECAKCLLYGRTQCSIEEIANIYKEIAYRRAYAEYIMKKVDIQTVPSLFLGELFSRNGIYSDNMILSPLGIVPIFKLEKEKSSFLRFGYFGGLAPVKDIKFLLEIFKEIGELPIREVPKPYLLKIWGNGTKEYIEELDFDSLRNYGIEYKGPYTPDQLPEILSEIDYMIMPSLSESYSFTVREALSGGVPVIASDIPAMKEIIRQGINGLLFESNNSNSLKQILVELIRDVWIKFEKPHIKTIKEDADEWEQRYKELLE
jgi:glycosyltransferase involved in cell wall biosynthesis